MYGDNGDVSTYPDRVDGVRVELPMTHEKGGTKPPCGICPKLEGINQKQPLPEDEDFGDWFFDARQFFREGRAVGGYGDLDPLMRGVIAEFHDADESRRQNGFIRAIVLGINAAVRR